MRKRVRHSQFVFGQGKWTVRALAMDPNQTLAINITVGLRGELMARN
jgi:hypothetical protein